MFWTWVRNYSLKMFVAEICQTTLYSVLWLSMNTEINQQNFAKPSNCKSTYWSQVFPFLRSGFSNSCLLFLSYLLPSLVLHYTNLVSHIVPDVWTIQSAVFIWCCKSNPAGNVLVLSSVEFLSDYPTSTLVECFLLFLFLTQILKFNMGAQFYSKIAMSYRWHILIF